MKSNLMIASVATGLLFCATAVTAQDAPAPPPAEPVAEAAPAQTPAAPRERWGEVGVLGRTMTLINLGSFDGPDSARTAISMDVSTVERDGDVAGEQTRWEFDCRARKYRGTGYRTIEADFTTGDFDPSSETSEAIIRGSMVEAISATACGTSETSNNVNSLREAVAHAREP